MLGGNNPDDVVETEDEAPLWSSLLRRPDDICVIDPISSSDDSSISDIEQHDR